MKTLFYLWDMNETQTPNTMQYTFSIYNIELDDWNVDNIMDALSNPTKYELRLDAHTEEGLIDEVYISLTDCKLPEYMNDGRRIPKYVHKAFADLVNAS